MIINLSFAPFISFFFLIWKHRYMKYRVHFINLSFPTSRWIIIPRSTRYVRFFLSSYSLLRPHRITLHSLVFARIIPISSHHENCFDWNKRRTMEKLYRIYVIYIGFPIFIKKREDSSLPLYSLDVRFSTWINSYQFYMELILAVRWRRRRRRGFSHPRAYTLAAAVENITKKEHLLKSALSQICETHSSSIELQGERYRIQAKDESSG